MSPHRSPPPPLGPAPTAELLEELARAAAALTGFSREALLPESLRRLARSLLADQTEEQLRLRLARQDPHLANVLLEAVTVGETFFFRHPEQFRHFAEQALSAARRRPSTSTFQVWSAGCASGEEAWSIAACLADLLRLGDLPPPDFQAAVLATDVLARNLADARRGLYGAWSQRPSAPVLHPVTRSAPGPDGAMLQEVLPRLRPLVRFAEHNLLTPAPGGSFDAIFCRNVLVYFAPEAGRAVLERLAGALAPGGDLYLGPMDAASPPPGLERIGPAQEQIWRRPGAAAAERAASIPRSDPPVVAPRPISKRLREPIQLHVQALAHVDRNEQEAATQLLTQLVGELPDYLPGLLERAMLHVRQGERLAATRLMREVLRRAAALPADEIVPGPEPLPARYFVKSAEDFLRPAVPGG